MLTASLEEGGTAPDGKSQKRTIDLKADKTDITKLWDYKTDKTDTENAFKMLKINNK
jgi:hypothetical protein